MKKTFDAPVGQPPVIRASSNDDIEFLKAQVRSIDNECRGLKESLRDRFAMAAISGMAESFKISIAYENESRRLLIFRGVAKCAFDLADEMLIVRRL